MMKHQRTALAILTAVWSGLLLGCGGMPAPSTKNEQPRIINGWPPQFVESKSEWGRYQGTPIRYENVFDLYAFSGAFGIHEMKAFCQERKDKCPVEGEGFYYVFIFDKASNAKFPKGVSPRALENDFDALKHIRAIYIYNKLNGFSELSYHQQNLLEHVPKNERI